MKRIERGRGRGEGRGGLDRCMHGWEDTRHCGGYWFGDYKCTLAVTEIGPCVKEYRIQRAINRFPVYLYIVCVRSMHTYAHSIVICHQLP